MPTRRWYEFDPGRTLVLALVLSVLVTVLVVSNYRRRLAAIPEPGRATPREVLDEGGDPPATLKPAPNPNPEKKP